MVPAPEKPTLARPPEKKGGGWLSVAFTTSAMMVLMTVLLLAPFGFIGRAFVVGGMLFVAITAFHYFVWGWWLPRVLRDEQEEQP